MAHNIMYCTCMLLFNCIVAVCTCMHVQSHLGPQIEDIVARLHSEVSSVQETLSAHMTTPPLLPHTPPIATKLLWLKALKERVSGPMDKVKEVAPYLLEGDGGWRLRQIYSQVVTKIDE